MLKDLNTRKNVIGCSFTSGVGMIMSDVGSVQFRYVCPRYVEMKLRGTGGFPSCHYEANTQ
jgi:hypothetical protein